MPSELRYESTRTQFVHACVRDIKIITVAYNDGQVFDIGLKNS